MFRHVIAPTRFYTQISNEIIRHPRLSSDAKCLLLWQLSLPEGVDESLSESARRAGIRKTAFGRAKRELLAEGYVHEWKLSGPRGRWSTTQLVSNVPLTTAEALAIRDEQCPPTAAPPAPGRPADQAVGHPQGNTGEETPNPPLPPTDRGADALTSVTRSERRLRLSGRDIRALAPLATEWLARGATLAELREALTSGLPDVVRSPAGLTRDRLTRKMPDPAPEPTPPPNPLRSCAGGCGRVFRPVTNEAACRQCRTEAAADDASGAIAATRRGMAAIRDILAAQT
ncbi:hypothetical protein [Streptomyces hesseae]|uniref:MarR family transcriptional regulator n=1 Tax=Streptomyces hesseae TaxID=3075519 RepID=A0ABU2SNS6_9ACTN|nr:hypothetical protein [Streptomyces sp. DSM 40473]MDT0450642.1 hypothetical protein [Streptomyces sp. DSM 40473]